MEGTLIVRKCGGITFLKLASKNMTKQSDSPPREEKTPDRKLAWGYPHPWPYTSVEEDARQCS